MILCVDVGNSDIVMGVFKGKRLLKQWRYPTSQYKIPAVKSRLRAVVVASVVPMVDKDLKKRVQQQYQCPVFFVTAQNIPGLVIRLKNKKSIGADRVINVFAANALYGSPAIVVDFGTATTFDVISKDGEYLGGAIAPGITMARDALHAKTAKLPSIDLENPRKVIGNDTISAMQSGLVYGYAALVAGMIARLKKAMGVPVVKTIATGGLAPLVCKHTQVVDTIDITLTLKGLRMVANDLGI
jgi:type III pantothenate kinase